MTCYVVTSNLTAFVAGLFTMRVLMRLGFLATDKIPDHLPKGGTMRPPRRARFDHRATLAIVGLVLSLLAFGIGVRVGFVILERQYSCVNDYANNLADSLEPRQQATETLQDREEGVYRATERLVGGSAAARDELAAALRDYRFARVRLDQERRENPYPSAPREVC